MIDLKTKQAFWAEQLPIFKEHYIMQAQLDVLYFDNESGNFEIKETALVDFGKEDFLETYHSVNTGWAMWLRAKSQEKAKAQAVPEDCVIVPKELHIEIALKMAKERIFKQSSTKDPIWNEIAEQAYKDNIQAEQCRLIRDYREMVKANESGAME